MVLTPALLAAISGGIAMSQPASAATTWEGLRQCESGGDYTANTGNGYYGAYQFSLSTWQSLGYTGLPSSASPSTQDEAALKLATQSGFGQWPVCGRGMGAGQLGAGASSSGSGSSSNSTGTGSSGTSSSGASSSGASSSGASSSSPGSATASSASPDSTGSSDSSSWQARSYGRSGSSRWAWRAADAATPSTAVASAATPFTTDLVDQVRPDVRSWQRQMNGLGYNIQIDGQYGPESAGAASHLQADKGLTVDGICGPQTWTATFS